MSVYNKMLFLNNHGRNSQHIDHSLDFNKMYIMQFDKTLSHI